jgi:hypothetical protein
MTVIEWLIIWFGVTFIIIQIRMTYVLRRWTITSVRADQQWRGSRVEANPMRMFPVQPTEQREVNWGRDGF